MINHRVTPRGWRRAEHGERAGRAGGAAGRRRRAAQAAEGSRRAAHRRRHLPGTTTCDGAFALNAIDITVSNKYHVSNGM